jgi:hypothetical protein
MRKEYVVLKCCHIDATVCGYADFDTALHTETSLNDISSV